MENLSRFKKTFNFEKVDRLPVMEWATWWNETIQRWRQEGLPDSVVSGTDIMEYFGLDVHKQFWFGPRSRTCPRPTAHGMSILENLDMDSYIKLKEHLYPKEAVNNARQVAEIWAEKQRRGEAFIWITLDGFFWHPRNIMGIEDHLYAFYDVPEVMHAMNEGLLEFNLRVLDEFCKICVPDFMTFAEDMSYNKGPMISKSLFEEFIAPYYNRIVPRLKEYGIPVIVDSDGDITEMIPWFEEVGVNGFLPLERQAGVDVVQMRKDHPKLQIIGGFDKLVMHLGEEAIRNEFERLLPVMKQGGFIPSCDHQTPPAVSIDNYRTYVRLLKEYCIKAME